MKKSFIAVAAASAFAALCLPVFSGCSGEVSYRQAVDENGEGYYIASVSGQSARLDGEYVIPEYYGEGQNRFPVKEIATEGFAGTGFTKITVPATVEKIGTAAFMYNRYLKEVEIAPASPLKEIPWGAFGYCTALKHISLPDGLQTIEGMAFYGCSALEELAMPNTVVSAGVSAFNQCSSLASVNFSSSLVSIGDLCFGGCSSLQEVNLPNSMHDTVTAAEGDVPEQTVPAIGVAAFYLCTALRSVKIGSGITQITNGAFGGCTALQEVYLPAGLKSVKGVYEGDGVVYMHAFALDSAIQKVYFGGTREQWEEVEAASDNLPYVSGSTVSDNSYLFGAEIVCGAVY